MPKVSSALWRDIMGYMRRRHAPICRQWFDELEPIDLEAGLMRIHAPNTVQQKYLQTRCLDQFTEAVQAVTNALVAVRFVHNKQELQPIITEAASTAVQRAVATGSTASTATATASPQTALATITEHAPRIPEADFDSATDQIVISPDYAFENFVVGPNNRLACAAAVAVANNPGEAYNPFFIHGGVGLGKTHLLQAICQQLLAQRPNLRICYLSCDAFVSQFMDCVQRGEMNQFRHRYRHVDVLVIDDIHFLANRERTQEEFFHTFNELYQSKRQIVLSSDSPPNEIPQLEERLVSRFQWGLVAPVSSPSYETRVAIVQAKAKIRSLTIPDDVVSYIATRIDTNARELEGAITTLQGHAALLNCPIDLALVQSVLGEPTSKSPQMQVTLQQIIDAVTSAYNVRLSDLQSKRRHKSITVPRQLCMWLARRLTRFSLQEIGGYFGGRDHTTVMHSIKIVDDHVTADPSFGNHMQMLEEQIKRH